MSAKQHQGCYGGMLADFERLSLEVTARKSGAGCCGEECCGANEGAATA